VPSRLNRLQGPSDQQGAGRKFAGTQRPVQHHGRTHRHQRRDIGLPGQSAQRLGQGTLPRHRPHRAGTILLQALVAAQQGLILRQRLDRRQAAEQVEQEGVAAPVALDPDRDGTPQSATQAPAAQGEHRHHRQRHRHQPAADRRDQQQVQTGERQVDQGCRHLAGQAVAQDADRGEAVDMGSHRVALGVSQRRAQQTFDQGGAQGVLDAGPDPGRDHRPAGAQRRVKNQRQRQSQGQHQQRRRRTVGQYPIVDLKNDQRQRQGQQIDPDRSGQHQTAAGGRTGRLKSRQGRDQGGKRDDHATSGTVG
jgi:hypothetical protein